MSGPSAAFRCEASPAVGLGHVMRCWTLADTLADLGWSCTFLTGQATLDMVPALAQSRHAVAAPGARPANCTLAVFDHYGLDVVTERAAREWADTIAVIDDLADRPHDCDILLDQTPGRSADAYAARVPVGCQLLMGAPYALLRPEFAALRRRERESSPPPAGGWPPRVLISLGGTDPDGWTTRVAVALEAALPDLEVHALVGPGTPHRAALEAHAQGSAGFRLHLGSSDVAGLLQSVDLVIGAGGVSALERCCLGCPSMVMVVAENQKLVAGALADAQAAEPVDLADVASGRLAALAAALLQDGGRRRAMAANAARLVDGHGRWRTAVAFAVASTGELRADPQPPTEADEMSFGLASAAGADLGRLRLLVRDGAAPVAVVAAGSAASAADIARLGGVLPLRPAP